MANYIYDKEDFGDSLGNNFKTITCNSIRQRVSITLFDPHRISTRCYSVDRVVQVRAPGGVGVFASDVYGIVLYGSYSSQLTKYSNSGRISRPGRKSHASRLPPWQFSQQH